LHSKKDELQELAKPTVIEIELQEEKVEAGLIGKAKGLSSILRERGLLDLNNLKNYSCVGRPTDSYAGNIDCSKESFRLENCPDYVQTCNDRTSASW
jgi:hypothetical protein